uniref:Uncharacterized protein n=1 Tax=Arundo donax TaxID=35708 RepID=A0A0A8Z763_ARUDO
MFPEIHNLKQATLDLRHVFDFRQDTELFSLISFLRRKFSLIMNSLA